MLRGVSVGCVSRAGGGWSGDVLIADCGDMEKPVSLRNSRPKVQTQMCHRREICRFHVRDLRGETPAGGNPEQNENEAGETVFEVENVKVFWSMRGDFICRHNEKYRSKLCVQDGATVSIPVKRRGCHEADAS